MKMKELVEELSIRAKNSTMNNELGENFLLYGVEQELISAFSRHFGVKCETKYLNDSKFKENILCLKLIFKSVIVPIICKITLDTYKHVILVDNIEFMNEELLNKSVEEYLIYYKENQYGDN